MTLAGTPGDKLCAVNHGFKKQTEEKTNTVPSSHSLELSGLRVTSFFAGVKSVQGNLG